MSKEYTLVKQEPQYEVVIIQVSRWNVFERYWVSIYKDYSYMPHMVADAITLRGAKRKTLKLIEEDRKPKKYPKEVARYTL